ncbi:MAG: hypothetical protein WBP54_02895 [Pelodictyon phaeoclathratiforme]
MALFFTLLRNDIRHGIVSERAPQINIKPQNYRYFTSSEVIKARRVVLRIQTTMPIRRLCVGR